MDRYNGYTYPFHDLASHHKPQPHGPQRVVLRVSVCIVYIQCTMYVPLWRRRVLHAAK